MRKGGTRAFGPKSDYYFGARSVIGDIKISLHESGLCRIALNEVRAKTLVAQGLNSGGKLAFTKAAFAGSL
jgi:hypothetical protein